MFVEQKAIGELHAIEARWQQESQTLQDLKALLALFEPDGTWVQGNYARTSSHRAIGPLEGGAMAWCMIGGLRKLVGTRTHYRIDEAVTVLGFCHHTDAEAWNDKVATTHEDVRARIRKGISSLS